MGNSIISHKIISNKGLVRDLNPGPLAPKARIIPLDQRADIFLLFIINKIPSKNNSIFNLMK